MGPSSRPSRAKADHETRRTSARRQCGGRPVAGCGAGWLRSAVWPRYLADLTTPQFAALYRLAEHGELDQPALGALTSIDRSTLTPLLERLEGRGLISKIIDPANRRRRLIGLTGAGRQRLSEAHGQAARTELWIDEVLGEARARQLVDMLRALGGAPPPG